ncbi:MAG: hypothetical protein ACYTHJ_01400 [Planctomycetota bacterium]|jgi:hypothetical protein
MGNNILRTLAVTSLVVMTSAVTARADDDVVVVTVKGEGISEESARNDALRKALEQGGAVEISSHSNVEDFALIRDTIYSRADGIVKDYKVLNEGPAAGGIYYCEIQAKVSKSAIASTWGEVQNVLDQVGRPGIAVYILERIDGIVQDSSILESKIENRLLDAGFTVFAGEQIRRIMEKESADAEADVNMAKVQAVAKDFGTQIFITGTAQANAAGVKNLAGQNTAMYNGDCMVKMYYTDTGQLLASESLPNWRGGARGHHDLSPQAGKKALSNAGTDVVAKVYDSVMRRWATRLSSGGEIELEVEGVTMGDIIKIKKHLKNIDRNKVKNVNHSLTKGIGKFRIKAKFTAEEFVEYLVEPPFDELIEVIDLKLARIQARKIGN